MYFDLQRNTFMETGRRPEKLAFAAADRNLSWAELQELSDLICAAFKKADVPVGHPVMIYGDKQAFFLAAVVACLREELPFICINNELPRRRMELIKQRTGSQVLVCAGPFDFRAEVTIHADCSVVSAERPQYRSIFSDVRYLIFTSGSQGEPKGVSISAQNLSEFIDWFVADFPVAEKTVFINQASFLFDIALADLFGALHAGATAVFNSSEQSRSAEFITRIRKFNGSYWNSTPSFVSFCLLHENFNAAALPSIKHFVLSGEQLSSSLVKKISGRFPKAEVINAYGPTETTIFASRVAVTPQMLAGNNLPIAHVGDGRLSIEDDEIIICRQVGSYLDGDGAFFTRNDKRCFKTGDGAAVKDEYIYFSGRSDTQLKLNGYRIDLEEIRHVLEELPEVRQALCLPIEVEGKVKRLVAFIEAEKSSVADIKGKLAETLPAYMIPSEVVALREFPRTHSFKSDARALLEQYLRGGSDDKP